MPGYAIRVDRLYGRKAPQTDPHSVYCQRLLRMEWFFTEGRDGGIRPRSLWALDQWHEGATFQMGRVLQLAEVQ